MQWGAVLVLAGLFLAGCEATTAVPDGTVLEIRPDLPAGYPPKIGDVKADLNGKGQNWDVYDYSIGAFDAAAQIMAYGGMIEFRLMGQPGGAPKAMRNRLVMKGTMSGRLNTGPLPGALIEIIAGNDWNGLRLSSEGQAVELVLDEIIDKVDGGYGHASGHFSAVLCAARGNPIKVDGQRCQTLTGTFDTDLQFSGL